jgi:hypothetical protein
MDLLDMHNTMAVEVVVEPAQAELLTIIDHKVV